MKITVNQLRKIIREEVENLTTKPLKDGGIVNRDSGEILDMDSVPPQYLDYVEVDDMGYTTLPNDKFEELRGEPQKFQPKPFPQRLKKNLGEGKGGMPGLPKPKDFSNLSTAQIRLQIAELKRQIIELETELQKRS